MKGLIASNVYDLAPLAEILNEVSVQFPNERPRSIVSASRLEALGVSGEEPALPPPRRRKLDV